MFVDIKSLSDTELCKAAKGRTRCILCTGEEVWLIFWDVTADRAKVQNPQTYKYTDVSKEDITHVSTIWPGMSPEDMGVEVTPEANPTSSTSNQHGRHHGQRQG